MPPEPHHFWQRIAAPGTYADGGRYRDFFPATLTDGRQLLLPIRVLPGDGTRAVASLIVNQASFEVEDALADAMADLVQALDAEVVVGVPTLGLPLANAVARRLKHTRMVPLGTSRKFWYRDELSEPLSSITSPGQGKTLFVDPRMLPLLEGKRVLVVDDVISSGTSMAAVLQLLTKAGIAPVGIAAAMLQGERWKEKLDPWNDLIRAPLRSPVLQLQPDGTWAA